MEKMPFDQYKVKMDGSGRISLRNRRFMRPITPYSSVARVVDVTEAARIEEEKEQVEMAVQQGCRRSGRSRQAPDRYGVAELVIQRSSQWGKA